MPYIVSLMTLSRRRMLGVLGTGGAFGLAGCADNDVDDDVTDDGDDDVDDDDVDVTDEVDDTDDVDGGDDDVVEENTVEVATHADHGEILVTADGLTLYMFDEDEQDAGESTCQDACANNWPPLTVDDAPTAGQGVDAELTTLEREDGSTQVTANGWPLYEFIGDGEPGETTGQGSQGVWWVLDAEGTPIREDDEEEEDEKVETVQVATHDEHGDILVTDDGLTLYMFDQDAQGAGESACADGCAENWPPLTVDTDPTAGTEVEAELTTFEREDGSTQVAANGWPLYEFIGDDEPGDATGQGSQGVWWVLDESGTPIRDDDVEEDDEDVHTVEVLSHDEHGTVLVTGDGLSLYMFDQDEQDGGASDCEEGCAENWPPLTVDDDPTAGPGVDADLTTFERADDGSTQVAANGWPLYEFIGDDEPGDVTGQGSQDVWWLLDAEGIPLRDEDVEDEDEDEDDDDEEDDDDDDTGYGY